ncbi:MAG: tRNA guanosine(34) transglycosylase Tgt [Alkalispirochaetaceae bacterium]
MKDFFTVTAEDSTTAARCGTLNLPRGAVETPVFMPVGTAGTVKAIEHRKLEDMGYNLILANTYHLYLRPGMEVIDAFGGIHRFSTWEGNILTDSGGYQVFSLSNIRKIREEGVTFASHIDGSRHTLTPEGVVGIQATLGSNIQMALDVCTGFDVPRQEAEEALHRTHRWAKRAREEWVRKREEEGYQGELFGIVQGNFYEDLRRESVEEICSLDLPGYAIGGLSVGESFETFERFTAFTTPLLPRDKPRYLMGIGTPDYIFTAVEHGVDMFDCVFPTRAGRNGTLFTRDGTLNLRNARFAKVDEPPDATIDSFGGRGYSLGYLRHLIKSGEILGAILATEHNLRFLAELLREIRLSIREGRYAAYKDSFLDRYYRGGAR